MTDFEKVLLECLLTLERGDSNVEECLSRHPKYALQLEPILLTSMDLERGREVQPSAAFKARVRAKLTQEMRVHPRKHARLSLMFMRIATNLAVIMLALLIAGTAYAQRALPGNPLYTWKLASENIWRVISPDPIGADLAIAGRRAEELIAVGDHPEQRAQLLESYLAVVARLKSETDAGNEARIRQVLNSQLEELNKSGILVPQLDQDVLPESVAPTAVPAETPSALPELPQVHPTLPIPTVTPVLLQDTAPVMNPIDSSKIVPTIEAPTIEVPPLLP